MRHPQSPKPRPARPPEREAPAGPVKPTPARDLAAPEPRETASSTPDAAEATLVVGGASWRVRVLGRSGRSGNRSPPLLVLGFWEGDGSGEGPAREATVVARRLSDLTPSRLEEAFACSSPPAARDHEKSFFPGVGRGRKGGAEPRDS